MRTTMVVGALLAASMALPQVARAQTPIPRYEPSQRMRALEGCMKDEVMNGAFCVKKCNPAFRLEFSGRTPVCIGLKSDAKYTPPKPEYETPKTPLPPGAPGS